MHLLSSGWRLIKGYVLGTRLRIKIVRILGEKK
jgi:hypothetical protein